LKYRILLVEDEKSLRNSIQLNLDIEGYIVSVASNGLEAVNFVKKNSFDLVIMDYMMPKLDGMSACKKMREFGITTPILFLSAKNQANDRIEGLKAGANDYLGKPFHLEELLLRIKLLLPSHDKSTDVFELNRRTINFQERTITYNGQTDNLSKLETKLIQYLVENHETVLSREDILDNVWDKDAMPSSRTIDNFILTLRKLIEDDPKNPQIIKSIRGVGYKIHLVD